MVSVELLEFCYNWGVLIWLVTPFFLIPLLLFVTAPYGKFTNNKFGFLVNGKWGWFIQETVSPVMFSATVAGIAWKFNLTLTWHQWLLIAMYDGHYFNRCVIYTLRMASMKPSPIAVVFAAILFNIVNGYINGYAVARLGGDYCLATTIIGVAIFIACMCGNISADNTLLNLRKGRDPKGYYIPQGGTYELISCPNYFWEIIEWFGFAIASNFNLAAISFVGMTIANLLPRALATHKWYREKFEEKYPAKRRAIIPFIL